MHRAIADGSFGYAQDDGARMAEEAVGMHRAIAGGSFDYAQDDSVG